MEAQAKSADIAYPCGSEWRRWDLHVHTPYSVLNNGFGTDFKAYAKLVFERAVELEIALIGVTDYFTIDGYKELRELQADDAEMTDLLGEETAARAREILLLPNIELRLGEIIHANQTDARVNLHVIFSESVDPTEIEENFLHQLRFTSLTSPGSLDERKSLTKANLAALGASLKEKHAPFQSKDDLVVGMEQAVIAHGEITDELHRNRAFAKRHLVLLDPNEDLAKVSWDGQGHNTRSLLLAKADMLFSANPSTREFGLGRKHDSPKQFEDEFQALKACVHGSDSHGPEELFHFALDRQLWIRANPSFDGLVQLVHEPEGRVFIGAEPEAIQRVRETATKSLDRIEFRRDEEAGKEQQWFSGATPLNPGLIAIIGKKGSGKSALADAAGLVGEARTRAEFSFLNDERFLNPRHDLGRLFEVELVWRSGEAESRQLDYGGDETQPERVRHIPQNYLEQICEEIQESSGRTLFDQELEAVIFSHVPRADRLGRETLRDLFEHKTEEKEARIKQLQEKLAGINREYMELLRRSSSEAKRALEAELKQREGELEAHRQAKPKEVADPSKDTSSSPEELKAEKELKEVVARIEQLDAGSAELREKEAAAKRRKVAAERLATRIENLEAAVKSFQDQSAEDLDLLGLKVGDLVSIKTESTKLVGLEASIEKELKAIDKALDEKETSSVTAKREVESKRAEELRRKLGEPARRYQEYQRALTTWKGTEKEIIGSEAEPKSVTGMKARLAALDRVPEEAMERRAERDAVMREIFASKSDLLDSYRELYSPVQRFIKEYDTAEEVDALSFDAEMAIDGLQDGLLQKIHQGRRGSFQGEQDGRARLRELIQKHDFTSAEGVGAFLDEVGRNLKRDLRDDEGPAVRLEDQLVQGASPEGLYDFLFGLDYLQPRFKLLWRGKPLSQLSPGERGTLLLIFYLLIDREDIPLVIDQPEENLDNETVAELLVPAVKNAKRRRQIILVTHNPNLAVVCDADQVIHARIDKSNGNRVTYTSGAIEDPVITQLIVDVLEGTKPAFDLRDAKYEVLDRANP
jgi:energy-coupling factor transporter ATP-binding protein EcfA2